MDRAFLFSISCLILLGTVEGAIFIVFHIVLEHHKLYDVYKFHPFINQEPCLYKLVIC